jgi:hypothetical protein
MSSLNIRDLPFVSDVAQADYQVPKVQGGQSLFDPLTKVSTDVSKLLKNLGFNDLSEEAAKGPERLRNLLESTV